MNNIETIQPNSPDKIIAIIPYSNGNLLAKSQINLAKPACFKSIELSAYEIASPFWKRKYRTKYLPCREFGGRRN